MNFQKDINALLKGDEQAFKNIYEKTKHGVFSIVIQIVKDNHIAEDVMQETYIKVLKKIKTYNNDQPFINWILTIAKNTAIDQYNKDKKNSYISINDNESILISDSSNNLLQSEYYLSFLDKKEKEIVLLKIVGGLKHKEISSLLKIPIGTSTSLYKRALEKMRKKSKKEER